MGPWDRGTFEAVVAIARFLPLPWEVAADLLALLSCASTAVGGFLDGPQRDRARGSGAVFPLSVGGVSKTRIRQVSRAAQPLLNWEITGSYVGEREYGFLGRDGFFSFLRFCPVLERDLFCIPKILSWADSKHLRISCFS